MRVHPGLLIKYACLVEVVDADLAGGVDDLFVTDEDAHMGDASLVVAEEGEVAGLRLLEEIHHLAALGLLRGIAGKEQTCIAGANLYEARTVDAHHCATAPKVRNAQEFLGVGDHQLWVKG